MEQFCKGTQAFRVINGTCGSVKRGNCKGNKSAINWEKENCPLPKRKRHKIAGETTSSCKGGVSVEQNAKEQDDEALKVDLVINPETVLSCKLSEAVEQPAHSMDDAEARANSQ